jgi:cyclase
VDRRQMLQGTLAGLAAFYGAPLARAQQDNLRVIDAGGSNVVAFSTGSGLVLVDTGAPKSGDGLAAALKSFANSAKVQTVFNTHYHLDQTANNEMFAGAGATIIAHDRTRQWMASDYWVPAEDRYEKARPKAALPAQTFQEKGSLKAGTEQIDYGYLLEAHTNGDIYVFFKNANVIAVGDVASPQRDPALDYFTGGWIGGRVDAMDLLLKMTNEQTRIVPAYGPVMTRAQFKAERDLMEEVRKRLFKQVREGEGPKDMLAGGVMNGLARTWKDPEKFLYDACKGLWGHHSKLDPNVV